MTRDVLISISGIHAIGGEDSDVELITAGIYYLKGSSHYILYDEAVEGTGTMIKNIIKITPSSLEIIKRGFTTVHMVFEAGKKTQTCYATPLGEIMIGLDTVKMKVEEEKDNIRVSVEYSLDINYELLSLCHITVDIKSRAGAKLHLL
ncbi:DUF1934 domain-containing protein [Lachnospiraceae bacterium 62-35]